MPQLLQTTAVDLGTTRLVTLQGELDVASARDLHAAVRAALDAWVETLVVDLAALRFVDSSGMHALLAADEVARAHDVRLVVLPGPPHVHRVFELAGLADRLPFAA